MEAVHGPYGLLLRWNSTVLFFAMYEFLPYFSISSQCFCFCQDLFSSFSCLLCNSRNFYFLSFCLVYLLNQSCIYHSLPLSPLNQLSLFYKRAYRLDIFLTSLFLILSFLHWLFLDISSWILLLLLYAYTQDARPYVWAGGYNDLSTCILVLAEVCVLLIKFLFRAWYNLIVF